MTVSLLEKTKKIKVVIVSDHKIFCCGMKLLFRNLKPFNFTTDLDNGNSLIEYLNESTSLPDIVLIDVATPEVLGIQTIKHISANFPSVKCIALSVHKDFDTFFRVIDAGAKAYLFRDSSPEFMEETITRVHTSGQFYSNHIIERVNEFHKSHVKDSHHENRESKLNLLSPREIEYITLCCNEYERQEIAVAMNISPRTVDGFRDSVFHKIGIKSKVGIALFAVETGLFKLEF